MTLIRYDKIKLSVDDLLQGDVKLASPPEIYARLRQLLDKTDSTTAMLAEVIEHDPSLSARILKLVNSAFYALPYKVDNIIDAVNYVGVREVQDVVLATEVIQRFEHIPPDLEDIYSFWRQSLRCAVLARHLAGKRKSTGNSDSLFLAGLLHRIGLLVMYTRIPELARKALLEHRHRGLPLHEVQQDLMGFNYADVGAGLTRLWELPEMLCTIIANHIHPEQAEAFNSEAALVHLSLAASQAESFEPREVEPFLPQDDALWESAGVTPEALKEILPEAENTFGAALALLR